MLYFNPFQRNHERFQSGKTDTKTETAIIRQQRQLGKEKRVGAFAPDPLALLILSRAADASPEDFARTDDAFPTGMRIDP